MKKIYISALSVLFAFGLNAQTTITAEDLPVAGDVFSVSYDETTPVVITAPGPSQTWDFTALIASYSDTFAYFNHTLTPQGNVFTNSDMATFDRNLGYYTYYKHKAGALVINGISLDLSPLGIDAILNAKPGTEETFIKNPTNYGTSFSENAHLFGKIDKNTTDYTDSIGHHYVSKTVTADSWGTITTSFGTYNAIRVRSYEITADTFEVKYFGFSLAKIEARRDTLNKYSFLIDTTGHPIVTIFANADSSIRNVEFLMSNSVAPTAGFYTMNTMVDVNTPVKFYDISTAGTAWEWNFGDGSAVASSQSPTHTYTVPGLYSVTQRVYNSVSSDTLTIVDYITVNAVTALSENKKLVVGVYPSPASDRVNFVFEKNEERTIEVYDLKGNRINILESRNNVFELNTSAFAAGFYFYIIKTNSEITRGKFSIVK